MRFCIVLHQFLPHCSPLSDLLSKNLLSRDGVLPPVFCKAVRHSVMGILIGQAQMHLKGKISSYTFLRFLCALFALCHSGVVHTCFNNISVVKILIHSSQRGKTTKDD